MRVVIAAAWLGLFGWAGSAPAGADPEPPAEPSLPINGAELQVDPLSALTGLLASSPQPPLLGAPLQTGTVSDGPAPDPLASVGQLLPQNYRMPGSDQASPYQLAPNSEPSPFARIDAWKGVHALTHGGLGRMPGDELGQPLPGVAPPPGVNLPPGLEQFYVDPAQASAPPA